MFSFDYLTLQHDINLVCFINSRLTKVWYCNIFFEMFGTFSAYIVKNWLIKEETLPA